MMMPSSAVSAEIDKSEQIAAMAIHLKKLVQGNAASMSAGGQRPSLVRVKGGWFLQVQRGFAGGPELKAPPR